MKKKIFLLALSALLSLCLFGCSTTGLPVDELMHPPKAIGDKAEIQALIDTEAGEGYTLKYPQSGNFRSAITMKDIDSDNEEEAVAFYLPVGDIATVHMLVMDRIDGTWQTVGDFKSQSTGIESLAFCDLDGNGVLEIVSCWKTYNATVNQVSVYIYEGNAFREVACEQTCSALLFGDFAEWEGDELLLMTLFSTEREASAVMLRMSDTKNVMSTIGSSPLDPDVVSYAQLATGYIFEDRFGAVIDGCTSGGEYSTQLIYFNTYFNSLERITFTENATYNQALRSYPVMSEDIDGDGIIEVPSVFKLKFEEHRTDVVSAAEIYWCQQTELGTVLLDKHQAASFSYSFSFDVPEKWDGKYTAYTNHNENTVTFYEWDKDKTGNELLSIKIFDKGTDSSDMSGYTVLSENDSYIYTYAIPDSGSKLLLSDEEIISAFSMM